LAELRDVKRRNPIRFNTARLAAMLAARECPPEAKEAAWEKQRVEYHAKKAAERVAQQRERREKRVKPPNRARLDETARIFKLSRRWPPRTGIFRHGSKWYVQIKQEDLSFRIIPFPSREAAERSLAKRELLIRKGQKIKQ
jgi:hypothetical protein